MSSDQAKLLLLRNEKLTQAGLLGAVIEAAVSFTTNPVESRARYNTLPHLKVLRPAAADVQRYIAFGGKELRIAIGIQALLVKQLTADERNLATALNAAAQQDKSNNRDTQGKRAQDELN